ncbi:hypothetical protein RI844_12830 [Thalassotalea fonticola]|uniref:DUF4410 domain-containing protein n=1 Tax=Thalassotalea fonticola TaxID=3065649 RepID=A0ABZ0GK67_9GAMM|nr:hypothetical protein RI844_12830 [Colwelliaceae bacterium S1-1]
MKLFFKTIGFLLLSFSLIACSGTVSSVDSKGEGAGHVYVISEVIAKRLMMAAMKSEFNPEDIKDLPAPKIGYHSKVQWGVDQDTIELTALLAQGKDSAGENVQGYVFSAEHSGTAPAAGSPTIDRLLAHIVKDAETLGSIAKFTKLIE